MRAVSDDRTLHIQGRLRLRRTVWLGYVACGVMKDTELEKLLEKQFVWSRREFEFKLS